MHRDARLEQALVRVLGGTPLVALFGVVWSDQRARLGVKKALAVVQTGAN